MISAPRRSKRASNIRRNPRMADEKLRYAIAFEAARLMYQRVESEYYTAKRKAAKRLCRHSLKPEDLPSNAEIRDQIQTFARLHEGDRRTANLRTMRLDALKLLGIAFILAGVWFISRGPHHSAAPAAAP